ncbi:MAG TPA: PaeR7I family type II restriction endonuclease [Candidatus Paceibacterota bacterium]|nr:PaeR7I family type II restriction endonuclease [Candidatus Paceibacterota bacterium]HRT57598.1 PaeR7I family type II restriction endonuclease [Candidatus Paceibacterota bacterium]
MIEPTTVLSDLPRHVGEAVRFYWETRAKQLAKQTGSGPKDQGLRSAVTGGAQMGGFVELLTRLVIEAGVDRRHIYCQDSLELPGYFRPTKQWDFLVVVRGQLVAALEAKSQVGPSFSNNFNNRTEEAMGSALDLWTAFRENAFGTGVRPWLGYLFLLEDCPRSRAAVGVKEPHFKVFEEFRDASYAKRYELFCRRLVLERHYDSAAFLLSEAKTGLKGKYSEPAADLAFQKFAQSLVAQVAAFSGRIQQL